MDLTRVNVTRLLQIAGIAGVWLLGFVCFILSALAVLSFYYKVELAQAIFLIVFPLAIVGAVSLSTSRLLASVDPEPPELHKMLLRHRLKTQIIGMISIFLTALFGMLHNLAVTPGF